ncbi:MAG: hypothetical protein IJF67_01590, partial [Clostridia bacterium]|nr:hypothetical protein [Clostridia bacterium]
MNFNLWSAFMLFLKKCQRIFVAPVSMFFRKITRKLNPQNIASKVASDVKQSVKGLTAKPTSIKEYFLIGDKYVAKKLVWAIAIAVLLIAALAIRIGWPWFSQKFLTRSMWVHSEDVAGYTGMVK